MFRADRATDSGPPKRPAGPGPAPKAGTGPRKSPALRRGKHGGNPRALPVRRAFPCGRRGGAARSRTGRRPVFRNGGRRRRNAGESGGRRPGERYGKKAHGAVSGGRLPASPALRGAPLRDGAEKRPERCRRERRRRSGARRGPREGQDGAARPRSRRSAARGAEGVRGKEDGRQESRLWRAAFACEGEEYPGSDSNRHCMDFESTISTDWITGALSNLVVLEELFRDSRVPPGTVRPGAGGPGRCRLS